MWPFPKKKKLPKGSMSYSNQPEETPSLVALGATELIIVGALIVIVLLLLNYHNIVPLSKMFPGQLGFLPHKTSPNNPVLNVLPTPATAPNLKIIPYISCPLPKDQCGKGKAVEDEVNGKKRYGIRFSNIGKDVSLLAAITGHKTTDGQNSLVVTSSERGIEVKYTWSGDIKFTGTVNAASAVNEKQVLGSFNDASNTLTLYATSTITKEFVRLGVVKDAEYLTNKEGP